MSTDAPTPVVILVHCAAKKAPCPKGGKLGSRKRKLPPRRVRTVAYKTGAFLEITCGAYQARCAGCKTFRNTPEPVLPRALSDHKVRDLVLERLSDDGMSVEHTVESLRRECLLELAPGFVYDVLDDRARQLALSEHRRKILALCSGPLCVDELHLGRFPWQWATDPLADLPLAFALVDANDQDPMRRFLLNLRNWGLAPTVVVTDGSNRDPAVLAALGPDADHPLGVVHAIKAINKLILDAVRRMRSAMSGRGQAGRKKQRGRQGAKSQAAAARRGMTLKEKAHFVFKRRPLIVKRRENLTEAERDDLARRREYLPEGATGRRFADRISWLFDTPKDLHQASCRHAAIVRDATFQAVPELARALKQRDEERFPKLMAYLANPVSRRVRTNHHVERTHRMFRLLEKVRDQWRRRRTLVRFVVRTLDSIWEERTTPRAKATDPSRATGAGKTKGKTRERGRAA